METMRKKKYTGVSIDFETLGMLQSLSQATRTSQSALVKSMVQDEVARQQAIQRFDAEGEINILRELYEGLQMVAHKTFVASARQQRNIIDLLSIQGIVLGVLDSIQPGVKTRILKEAKEHSEKEWPEIATKFGYSVLPESEGGLAEG